MALNIETRDVRVERYFPDVLANAKEFMALGAAVDPELKLNWHALIKQMLNTFVYDLDVDGAARWEKMLKLHTFASDTLDIRRRRILTKINSILPYTFRSFQNMLDGIYGEGEVTERLKANDHELWLDLRVGALASYSAITRLARVIVPANLTVVLGVERTNDFNVYAGGSLSQHKRITVSPAEPTDQTWTEHTYAAGAMSQHFRYDVSPEPPTNHEVQDIMYFGGGVSRHKKFTVAIATE